MDLTEGEQKRLEETAERGTWDRTDWERFHQTRRDLFRKADLRGNTSQTFYIVNHVDTVLAEQLGIVEYAFPRTRTSGLIEKNWVLRYDTVYYLYPWATPYEDIVRRDLPEVVDELTPPAFRLLRCLQTRTVEPKRIQVRIAEAEKNAYHLPA
jgi:hypothetical protein